MNKDKKEELLAKLDANTAHVGAVDEVLRAVIDEMARARERKADPKRNGK